MQVQELLELGLPGPFPRLEIADASQIGMAIALCWVIGWAWREIRRSVNSSERGD